MEVNEPAYLFKNIKTDGILPHVFLGKAMVHLLCKRGSMSFYFAGQRVVAQEGCLVLWQMRSNIQQVQYSPDFDADYFIITRSCCSSTPMPNGPLWDSPISRCTRSFLSWKGSMP